jgi:ArsR family transcriptional regulator
MILHENDVKEAGRFLLEEPELFALCSFYKMLADPTRMKICLALSHQSLCVCDLSALLEMSESAISHQLRLLKQSRIVIGHKKGKHVYYELADYHIYKIIKGTQEHLNE